VPAIYGVGFRVLAFKDFGFRFKGLEFRVLGCKDFGFRVKLQGFRILELSYNLKP
jgi:hypothetical protein